MKIKICGVQSVEEAERLAEMGVDFIGLNFVPSSSRRIELQTGKMIAVSLKRTPTNVVTLFQNQPLGLVQHCVQEINPDYVQLHGSETDDYIAKLHTPVIKSIIPSEKTVSSLAEYYLLDRSERGQGPVVDIKAAAEIIAKYPGRVFLAGGLTPDNLPAILTKVQPFGIDIAGGVRTDNTLDFDKVTSVLKTVRSRP